jgi:hypothetical protein
MLASGSFLRRTLSICISSHLVPVADVVAAAANNEKEASRSFVPAVRRLEREKRGCRRRCCKILRANSSKFIRNLRTAPPFRTRCHFLCSPEFSQTHVRAFHALLFPLLIIRYNQRPEQSWESQFGAPAGR